MIRHAAALLALAALHGCGPTTVETRPDPTPPPRPTTLGFLPADFRDAPEVAPRDAATTPGGPVFTSVRGQPRQLRWSPRGDLIAAATTDHTIVIIDPRDGAFRAARRVHVRSNAFTELGWFDATGTRLMIDIYGHSDPGIVAVWDLATDRWVFERRSTEREPPAAVFVGEHVAYYEPHDASVRIVRLDTGAETRIEARLPGEPGERGPQLDSNERFVFLSDTHHVLVLDPVRGRVLGEPIEGRLVGVRTRGGLLSVLGAEGSIRLIDPSDQSVRHEIPGPDVHAFFDPHGMLVVDRGSETIERTILDPRTRETLASGEWTATPNETFDDLGTARLFRNEDGTLQLQTLGEAPETLRDVQYVLGASIAPGRDRIVVAAGRELMMLDADGDVRWSIDNDLAGEASVWDIAPTPTGFVSWGRAGAEHWSGAGRLEFRCAGQGWPFELNGRQGWATLTAICVGDDAPRTPPSDARIVGLDGQRYVALRGSALDVYELSDDRRRGTHRLGSAVGEIYSGLFHPLGRGGVFFTWNGAWFVGRGAAQPIEPRPAMTSQVYGDHLAATHETSLTIFDARRTKVLELDEVVASDLARDGSALAYAIGDQVFVVSLPRGDEVMRIRPPEGEVKALRLRGDSLALVHGAESTIWHVPSVSQRVRFDARAPFELDSAGTSVAVCEHARLTVRSTLDGTERALGDCPLAESVHFVAGDTRVAVKSRTIITLHHPDREGALTLRTLRAADGAHAIAFDGEKLWASLGALAHVSFRAPGPITAELIDPATRVDPDLLTRFFLAGTRR